MRRPPFFYLFNLKKMLEMLFSKNTYSKLPNWPLFFADYLGLIKGVQTLQIDDCKFTFRAGTVDKWPIQEVILKDDYHLQGLDKLPRAKSPRYSRPSGSTSLFTAPPGRSLNKNSIKTVIDLGTHIGTFAIYASKLFPQAKIYAYEPDSESFRFLKKNISLNHAKVYPHNLACYSDKLIKETNPRKWPKGIYRFSNKITLSKIFKLNNITSCDLLKMDIEGAEYGILYSLSKSLLKKIRRIHLEYHDINKKTDLNGDSLDNFLKKHGFSVVQRKFLGRKIGFIYATNTNFIS